jgi:hypothetical protein
MTTSNIPIRVRCSGLCAVHCDGSDEVDALLADIALVDQHLDDAAPQVYRQDQRTGTTESEAAILAELNEARALCNLFRRVAAGPASEGQEAVDAVNLATGGNPRKGVIGDTDTILGELGDGAVANLLAIQSILKNTDLTWQVFIAAMDKAVDRVPGARP